MHTIRIVDKCMFFGEESKWCPHEDVDQLLGLFMIDEEVANKKRKLAKEFNLRSRVFVIKYVVFVLFLQFLNIFLCLLSICIKAVLENMNFFNREIEPFTIGFMDSFLE